MTGGRAYSYCAVVGAAGHLAALLKEVNGLQPPVFGLASVVQLAQIAVAHGNTQLACLWLTEFNIDVVFHPWSIQPATADKLIDDAMRIENVLGC